MAAATENDGAATEHSEEPQLAELLNQEAGQTGVVELEVVKIQVIDSKSMEHKCRRRRSQKVQVASQSKIPKQ